MAKHSNSTAIKSLKHGSEWTGSADESAPIEVAATSWLAARVPLESSMLVIVSLSWPATIIITRVYAMYKLVELPIFVRIRRELDMQ